MGENINAYIRGEHTLLLDFTKLNHQDRKHVYEVKNQIHAKK